MSGTTLGSRKELPAALLDHCRMGTCIGKSKVILDAAKRCLDAKLLIERTILGNLPGIGKLR